MNLIDVAKSDFSADIVQKISSFVGESPDHTQRAVDDAVPSVFAGMMEQASSPSGATRLFDMAKQSGQDKSGILSGLGSLFSSGSKTAELGQRGQGLMHNLFGDREQIITDKVASHAGVSQGAAQKIFSLVGPVAMAVVGKEVVSRGLNAGGLTNMLASHKSDIVGAVGGLGLGKIFSSGVTGGSESFTRPIVEKGASMREPVRGTYGETRTSAQARGPELKPTGTRWLPLLLLGALIAIGLSYMLRGTKNQRTPAVPNGQTMENRAVPSAESIGLSGERLGQYLDSEGDIPKSFVLNGLTFGNTGSLIPGTESAQLDGIATALKAHESARVTLSGYGGTESEGTTQAEAVRDQLVKRGVSDDQLTVTGHAAIQGGTGNAAGQTLARRVELIVTAR